MAQTTCHNCGYPWAVQGENCPNCGASNGCFITTAVCLSLGKDDFCEELQLLREFRDQFILQLPNGKTEVDHYYSISPRIVKCILQDANHQDILNKIHSSYIEPAIDLINAGHQYEAYQLYKSMVVNLERQYIGV